MRAQMHGIGNVWGAGMLMRGCGYPQLIRYCMSERVAYKYEDSLLTSLALLLNKIVVERSETRVTNSRRTGNSILHQCHEHLQTSYTPTRHAPKH